MVEKNLAADFKLTLVQTIEQRNRPQVKLDSLLDREMIQACIEDVAKGVRPLIFVVPKANLHPLL